MIQYKQCFSTREARKLRSVRQMPTGYTYDLYDGKDIEFPDFVMKCARAFGALIEIRDDPMDAAIPTSSRRAVTTRSSSRRRKPTSPASRRGTTPRPTARHGSPTTARSASTRSRWPSGQRCVSATRRCSSRSRPGRRPPQSTRGSRTSWPSSWRSPSTSTAARTA